MGEYQTPHAARGKLRRMVAAFESPTSSDPGEEACQHVWQVEREKTHRGEVLKSICTHCCAFRPPTRREALAEGARKLRWDAARLRHRWGTPRRAATELGIAASALSRRGFLATAQLLGASVPLRGAPLPQMGVHSSFTERASRVVTTQEEWASLFARGAQQFVPPPAVRPIDFAAWDLAFVSMGQQRTGGYDTRITAVYQRGPLRVVQVEEWTPQGGSVTQSHTAPADAVLIPRHQGQTVFIHIPGRGAPTYQGRLPAP